MSRLSLRARLTIGFLLLTAICWGAASISAWFQARHNINQLFDTQQMLFARHLAALTPDTLSQPAAALPESKKMLRHHRGEQEDDALAFAIFTRDGKRVLDDGDNGRDFLFEPNWRGFRDGRLRDDDDLWRTLWLNTPDGRYVVAVGQEREYRDEMTADVVRSTLLPWLAALPVMALLLLWLLQRELAPLRQIAHQLQRRSPDSNEALNASRLPTEVRPMADALNDLFARIHAMLQRERRFTSDAAHELRSPLAALKVQSEVVQLAHDDAAMRQHALSNLDASIDRATRLVDQLLTLSRLDAQRALAESETVDAETLLQQAIVEQDAAAQRAGITLRLEKQTTTAQRWQGHPLLLSLLLRNLLDNAIRYGRAGGSVTLILRQRQLEICDDGPGVDAEALERIGERFYRPPGQEKSGSGLGLSIVQHIAALHGMRMRLANRPQGGFSVTFDLP
ncbi:quorum sensing histidine kinase QseC [Mixta gaviniae]|uniref:Sensor protein QseC n=1 Tax=Mixta gaviniae TaxID=665914 RepID=A0A2L0ILK3_9GAMM|nr:quorum sensing histidine kinase QseC [Mixta gaviniae]AUX95312.1 two-component system sensor histidine kinase QseC [Mixta gaviniae]